MITFGDIFGKSGSEKPKKNTPGALPEQEHANAQPLPGEVKPDAGTGSDRVDFSAVLHRPAAAPDSQNKPNPLQPEEKKPVEFFSLFSSSQKPAQAPAVSKSSAAPEPAIDFLEAFGGSMGMPEKGNAHENAHTFAAASAKSVFAGQPAACDVSVSGNIYPRALALADTIFNAESSIDQTYLEKVRATIRDVLASILACEQDLLAQVFSPALQSPVFAVSNMVNTSIIAMEIGLALEYKEPALIDLGAAAFLHKVGLKEHRGLINQKRKLTEPEKERLHNHPLTGALQAQNNNLSSSAADAIAQHQERLDGSGYPKGLKRGEISEAAQIIGLADVYEALTHERPYRKRYTPMEALKIILENKAAFSQKLTKAMLNHIGLYPRGTRVELNTREIAEVVRQNADMPLCPVVRVVSDAQGHAPEQLREIDLSKGTKVFISKSV